MARFIGGPCDGRTSPPPTEAFRDCGGSTYALLGDRNYHYIGEPLGAGGSGTLNSKQVDRAWRGLMHVYSVEVPAAIRKSRAGRARLRRRLR